MAGGWGTEGLNKTFGDEGVEPQVGKDFKNVLDWCFLFVAIIMLDSLS